MTPTYPILRDTSSGEKYLEIIFIVKPEPLTWNTPLLGCSTNGLGTIFSRDDIRKVRVEDLQLLYAAINKVPTSPVTLLVSHCLSVPSLQRPVGCTSHITRLASNLHLLENSSLEFIDELRIYHGYDTFRQARMLKKEGNIMLLMQN